MSASGKTGRSAGTAPAVAVSEALPAREAVAALQAHPRFPAAVRATAGGVVALYQSNPILNRLINDRARLLFGLLVVDLHFAAAARGERGFTATQARDACVAHRVCSAGRTTAMIALMRFGGYLEALPAATDRRERRFGVTDRLIAAHAERWRHVFAAVDMLRPDGRSLLAALRRPAFIPALARVLVDDFRAGVRVVVQRAPELLLFAERNSGVLILFSLVAAGSDEDTMPPSRPVPVSISALARRFGVSRAHVLKLLRDAAGDGLIALDRADGHRVTFSPRLSQALRDFFATAFIYIGDCAGEALAADDREGRAGR